MQRAAWRRDSTDCFLPGTEQASANFWWCVKVLFLLKAFRHVGQVRSLIMVSDARQDTCMGYFSTAEPSKGSVCLPRLPYRYCNTKMVLYCRVLEYHTIWYHGTIGTMVHVYLVWLVPYYGNSILLLVSTWYTACTTGCTQTVRPYVI
jgi:hypothetical protein